MRGRHGSGSRSLDQRHGTRSTRGITFNLAFLEGSASNFEFQFVYACLGRWGLIIEMVIEALALSQIEGSTACSIDHFSRAYAKIYSVPIGNSPFTMPNCRDAFDPKKLVDVLNRTK